jgi:hypothetical protein
VSRSWVSEHDRFAGVETLLVDFDMLGVAWESGDVIVLANKVTPATKTAVAKTVLDKTILWRNWRELLAACSKIWSNGTRSLAKPVAADMK